MILTCPACRTRYLVDDAAVVGDAGRQVRCANCSHSWHFVPGPVLDEQPAADAQLLDPARIEPGLDAPPAPIAGSSSGPSPGAAAAHAASWVGIGWLALILLLAVAILAGIVARDEVVAMWPPAARLYAFAGIKTELPGAGLEIRKILPTRTTDGLVIEGEIANLGATALDVPRLRVALLDPGKKEIQFKIIEPPKERLLPGEVARFKTPFQQTDASATKVAVTFASG